MQVYTVSEVADLVGVSAATVRKAIHVGKLKAYKEPPGPGGKYQITRDALETWMAGRQGKDRPAGEEDNSHRQSKEGERNTSVSRECIRDMESKLHAAIYRAGRAEERACLLGEELARLRDERDREREKYQSRIRELENRQYEQQKYVLERLEAREKAVLEFIAAWRESAAGGKEKKQKPWWKITSLSRIIKGNR